MITKQTKKCFLDTIGYLLITIFTVFIASLNNKLGYVAIIILLLFMLSITIKKISKKRDITSLILYPLFLTTFQNVYLGFFAYSLSSTIISLLVILNFLYACILLLVLMIYNINLLVYNKFINRLVIIFLLLVLYSFMITIVFSSSTILSIISSFRNIITMFIFALVGILVYKNYDMSNLFSCILILGVIVIIIGFYERSTSGLFWRRLNITELWMKKGIRVQPSGLPTAFYSSETINGKRILRMCSTFADPVNLGSFLVVVFAIAKRKQKHFICILALIAIIFTVSKGGLLGVLIILCVESYYKKNKIIFYSAILLSLVVGISFLIYAQKYNAASVFLHISGFTSAFSTLKTNFLGYGLGSVGVLARQYGNVQNLEITESGLGMIIGQLGFMGLLVFFIYIFLLICKTDKTENVASRSLAMGLLLYVVINIIFNEVALSPNSCGIIFAIIGINIRCN